MTGRRTPSAIARTARRSPSDALGNPASITSTPSVSSWRARRSFSSAVTELPGACSPSRRVVRSEEHTSELQSRLHLVCRLLLEKKKNTFDKVSQAIPKTINYHVQPLHLIKGRISSLLVQSWHRRSFWHAQLRTLSTRSCYVSYR